MVVIFCKAFLSRNDLFSVLEESHLSWMLFSSDHSYLIVFRSDNFLFVT